MPPGGDALGTKAVRSVTCLLAPFALLLAGTAAVPADEFKTPAISVVHVDWRAALDQFRSEISTRPAVAADFTFTGRRRLAAFDPRATPALVQLNGVTSQIFTGIGRSPVPVLLPFDAAAFLEAQSSGAPASLLLPPICSMPVLQAMMRCFRSIRAPARACRREHLPDRSRCRSPVRW
jgi:hypothetical protein